MSTTKHSGIPWLGELPANWEVKRIKAVVVRSENGAWGDDEHGDEHDVYCYRAADFDTARMVVSSDKLVKRHIDPDVFRKKAVRPEHLLIEKSGGGENVPVGRVVRSLLKAPAVFSNFLGLIEVDASKADSNFMRYQFWHLYDRRVPWRSIKQTTGLQNLDTSSYFNEPLAFPSLPEQRAIAAFLDERTARIDGLLARKQRLVQLLMEKRQALITRAVTRGLDAKVNLKESGVPWLGEVPEHWAIEKFFRIVNITEGQVNPEIEPYIDMLLIAPNHIESRTGKLIARETSAEQAAESGKYLCPDGAVVYSKIRPALRKATMAPEACLCSADMYPMVGVNGMTNDYLLWLLLCDSFSQWVVLDSDRVAMPKVNRETMNAYWLPLPPVQEQDDIVTYITEQNNRLDALITKVDQAVLR